MPTPSPVDALVVTHDSAEVLPACLAALAANGVPAIVVDNASRDGSADIAAEAGATVIHNAANEGYGRANNRAARAASAEWLLIVNPDVALDPGAVGLLLEAAARYPDAGLLAPRIIEPSGRHFFQMRSLLAPYLHNPRGKQRLPEGDCCAPFLSGACLMIRRELFLGLGGFDPRIFLFYEDDDLCRRVADSGHALVHVQAAKARHGRGRSSAPAPGRVYASRWHQAWSRAYASRKYGLPSPAWSMILLNLPKAAAARLVGRTRSAERYGGSAAGAWAFLSGSTAMAREGLPEMDS